MIHPSRMQYAMTLRFLPSLRERYFDILTSVYIQNEHLAYVGLERMLAAVQQKFPEEREFIAAVAKHVADERKHYALFKHYFQSVHRMPFVVDRAGGYVDRFVRILFHHSIDELNTEEIVSNDALFFRLCRLIMMTEFRGIQQVAAILKSRLIRRNARLCRIFQVIEVDEPSHCIPYRTWLRARGSAEPQWQERIIDQWIHYSLMLVTLPLLYVNAALPRRRTFQDEGTVPHPADAK